MEEGGKSGEGSPPQHRFARIRIAALYPEAILLEFFPLAHAQEVLLTLFVEQSSILFLSMQYLCLLHNRLKL